MWPCHCSYVQFSGCYWYYFHEQMGLTSNLCKCILSSFNCFCYCFKLRFLLSLFDLPLFFLWQVLQGVGFHFPICLSFIHYALSWALMAIIKAFSVLPASPPSKSSRLSLFTLGFVMSLSTGLANVSLKYNRLDIHFLFYTTLLSCSKFCVWYVSCFVAVLDSIRWLRFLLHPRLF